MTDKTPLSRQQQKSRETKSRIFRAAKKIMQTDGYEALSIKNICEEAGVSNGSFYHHFKTKDDLLSYYIEEQPGIAPELLRLPSDTSEAVETIIQVYLNYAKYCRELGVDFIASYYTPKNQALHPSHRPERSYPIVTVERYLEQAVGAGIFSLKFGLAEITTDIRSLIIGNVFEWCLTGGAADLEENIRRSFTAYLENVLTAPH